MLIAHVVGEGMEQEVESGFVGTLFKFLPLVLLVAEQYFECAVGTEVKGVVKDCFIVVDALEG